jgi:predicted DNA-binding mobile mystery protein A
MARKTLPLQHLSNKMEAYASLTQVVMPPTGWIKAIRTALGMSMQQLGNKVSVTKQGIMEMENREKEGAITIKSLREVAKAMDMKLVYGFVPNDGSLDALIEKKAKDLATKIVMRTANTMKLEDQGNTDARINNAIKERTDEIIKEMPKILWD